MHVIAAFERYAVPVLADQFNFSFVNLDEKPFKMQKLISSIRTHVRIVRPYSGINRSIAVEVV